MPIWSKIVKNNPYSRQYVEPIADTYEELLLKLAFSQYRQWFA
jgi:hypothetical protein